MQPPNAPAAAPVPVHDVPTTPHALPAETQIVPSIENEVEQSIPAATTVAAAQQVENAETTDVSTQPEPAHESQATAFDPSVLRGAKYAKKTSDITKSRGDALTVATPPASQTVVSTTEGSETPAASVAPSTPEPSQASTKGKKRKTSKDGTEADKPKRMRRRKREPTPEGAETVEILPNVVKMSELCKDLKTGRKSKRETELRKIEFEEHERKVKTQEEGSTAAEPAKETAKTDTAEEDRLPAPKPQAGPVMRIVNGEIVLDTASLEVDRHADAARSAGDLEDVVENQLTRKINQATYGKRTKTEVWDEEMTDLFYRGLRMFGTDFMVISKLFPGRSRRQIKLKFNNEERRDPQRIKDTLLGPREAIDIATYSEMTNQVYDDPKVIQQELDEEKRQIEEQHEKEKKLQEELMRNPTGAGAEENAGSSDKANGAPAKGKARNSKKQNMKNQGGGTEEVLGTIDDMPMP